MAIHAIWTLQRTKHIHEIHDQIFQLFIGHFLVVYFDDILIYSKTNEEHIFHLQQVMSSLSRETLCEHKEWLSYEVECLVFGL